MAVGTLDAWNIDEERWVSFNRRPQDYLRKTYYELWYAAVTRLLVSKGLASESEIAGGKARMAAPLSEKALRPDGVPAYAAAIVPYERQAPRSAGFAAGGKVRARNLHPKGHTQLPRYLRGRVGEIVKVHGAHVFPDSNSRAMGEDPQWLYTVKFTAHELWGLDSTDLVHADLWEPYLEPA